jgi:hypothetical protein
MGLMQARQTDDLLRENHPALHQIVAGPEKEQLFGLNEPTLNPEAQKSLGEEQKKALDGEINTARKASFARVAVLPAFMLICYLLMFSWFRSRGGYKPVEIAAAGH